LEGCNFVRKKARNEFGLGADGREGKVDAERERWLPLVLREGAESEPPPSAKRYLRESSSIQNALVFKALVFHQ
jgi:hypothetical protein